MFNQFHPQSTINATRASVHLHKALPPSHSVS
jgi:hypothetical protein